MREIEIKVLGIGHKDLEEKILRLGGDKVFDLELLSIKYDRDDHKISDKNENLRLRKKGDSLILTHKGAAEKNDKGLKIKEETEVEISDLDNMRKILRSIGFEEVRTIKKRRIVYKLDNVEIVFDTHLDEYSYIPEFLEIEAPDEDLIKEYIQLLGLEEYKTVSWGVEGLIDYYSKR